MNIAIIGAGITGLAAAYHAQLSGHRTTIFEQSDTVGGLGSWVPVGGSYIERYYHHFFQTDKEVVRLANELGIGDKLHFYKAKTGIFSGGTIYPFGTPKDVLAFPLLPLIDRVRCGATTAALKFFPYALAALDRVSAADWVKRFAGQRVYDTIWGPLLEGKFSGYTDKVPALWLWGRVRDRSFKLGYFTGSTKTLFDALTAQIRTMGGVINTETTVKKINQNAQSVAIQSTKGTKHFDAVLLTAVSPVVSQILGKSIPVKIKKQLESVDHLGAVCMIVELTHKLQSQYWLNVCTPHSPVLALIEHTNYIPPECYNGKHILYLANYIHRTDTRYNVTQKKMLTDCIPLLTRLNKAFKPSWITRVTLIKHPRAQTIFKLGSLAAIPPHRLNKRIYMANIDHMYPHDRNINQGAELGKKVMGEIISSLQG